MNFKWIGATLIICGCGLVGFSMSAAYRREERELRQFLGALDYMACELQYRLTPLPELCRQAGRERSGITGKLLTHIAQELELQIAPDVQSCIRAASEATGQLPQRIDQALILMGTSLGRFDLDGQLQGLESVRVYCRSELESMAQGQQTRLRSYQTLGLCAGAAIAILFV